MKRALSLLLALLAVCCAARAEDLPEGFEPYRVSVRTVPFYIGSPDVEWEYGFPLYFINDASDLPYVELNDWRDVMVRLYHDWLGDSGYALELRTEETTAEFVRENAYYMRLDFDAQTILWGDYDGFIHPSGSTSLLDILGVSGFSEQGEAELFQRIPSTAFDRYGDAVQLDLGKYGISILRHDTGYYVPLQTLSDFMLSLPMLAGIYYNGQAIMLANGALLGRSPDNLTPLGEIYYSGIPRLRSPELAEYGYAELCMALDHLYGLRQTHEIESFDKLFWQIGYDEHLKSADAAEADAALFDFIQYFLDDVHSGALGYSWMAGAEQPGENGGLAVQKIDESLETYALERRIAFPQGVPAYQEVGNTAYVTFDSFVCSDPAEYYAAAEAGDPLPDDTVGRVIYAHQQITRPDSPIENVVIDLSTNLGGEVDAAIFVLGWFLGKAPYSEKNTFTGAVSTAVYRSDVNLDRRFDIHDTLIDKRLYCLISPNSFSCGNLVPAIFKSSQKVTLLGRTSGGGSCAVLPFSTAWGTVFQISGPRRMSFLKNGSFYDIDQGVAPDCFLNNIASYYDREALTDFINGLF